MDGEITSASNVMKNGGQNTSKMKGKLFLILDADEEESWMDNGWAWTEGIVNSIETPQISLNALTGVSMPQTMRMQVVIKGIGVTALIDIVSTHNYMDPRIVKRLRIPLTEGHSFLVKVANGETIKSQRKCNGVLLRFPNVQHMRTYFFLSYQGVKWF